MEIYTKASELPTKTEVGRAIVAILRCNPTLPPTSTSGIARPLWDMVLQDKWPVVRSEGLLGLALLARNEDGRKGVWEEWGEKEMDVLETVQEKDLENAAGLVASTLKEVGDGEKEGIKKRAEGLLESVVAKKTGGV
jgi:hypothetical protein